MRHDELLQLAKSNRWQELEQAWLAAIDDHEGDVPKDDFLAAIEQTVKAGQNGLAETMAWAWLTAVKTRFTPRDALELARALLLRLPSGEQLRDEMLSLYRQTHDDPHLDRWIALSGLNAGKSVRRALRFLDVGLKLKPGIYLMHRSDDDAAELTEVDLNADSFTIRVGKRTRTLSVETLIDEYDPASPDDFRVMQQLNPERITELAEKDPTALLIGVTASRNHRISRDDLKFALCPRYVPAESWNDWWTSARNAIKRSRHLRVEGRSPVMIIHEPGGLSLEEETWGAFQKADSPRGWLEVVEGYLRECKARKAEPVKAFLERVQSTLLEKVRKYSKHEPAKAFATALVIRMFGAEGLPPRPEADNIAIDMLRSAERPSAWFDALPDSRFWPLATEELQQAQPEKWPDIYGELLLTAGSGQLDDLARALEAAGRYDLVSQAIQKAVTAPESFVDLFLWIWRGPALKTPPTLPPRTELLTRILALVGPARLRSEAISAVTVLRGKVRAALATKGYAAVRETIEKLDESMARAMRRQIERAEGLGPVAMEEMLNIIRDNFPNLYAKAKVATWDEEGVLYVTRAGLRTKEAELDELVNVKMRENAKAIGEAAEHGDLSENSEYKFALEERDLLRARLATINHEMSMARVLEPEDIPTEYIGIGHEVSLEADDGSETITVTLLSPWESNLTKGIYSYQTPLARKLLGHKPDDRVSLAVNGDERAYRIIGFKPVLL